MSRLSSAIPSARITQREIAKAAGMHFSTVSLALRDSPLLPLATRKRVKQIAKSLHYQPDPMLAALNAYRTRKATPHYQATIAWINNWPDRSDLRKNPTFNEYFLGASERAKELGYKLEEFWLAQPDISLKKAVSILKARNIKGLLLAPQPYARTFLALDYKPFSVLSFGYSLAPSSFHLVTNHHYHCMNLMLKELDRLNYRRVGVVLTREWDDKVDNHYLSGILVAIRKRFFQAKLFLHITPNLQQKNFTSWLKKCSLDVVVSLSSHAVIEQWIKELGLKVPGDIGIAGLGVSRRDTYLSGVHQNNATIGSTAIDFLVGMLHRGECGIPEVPIHILIENSWRPGQTLRQQR